jgi:hypothetical protein
MKFSFLSLVKLALVVSLAPLAAIGQVAFDVTVDELKTKTNSISLADLSVNDTAYIYPTFCVREGVLHLPSTTRPTNFAEWTSNATGITFQVTMLPGKRVSLKVIEAAKAQRLSRGDMSEMETMTREQMLLEAADRFERFLVQERVFGVAGQTCSQLQEGLPLVEVTFLEVSDIDGHQSIKSLLGELN